MPRPEKKRENDELRLLEVFCFGSRFLFSSALSISKFVIVILSTNSVDKAWPKKELNAALAREIDGYVKVLPLVVGSEGDTNVIFEKLPLLEDKLYKKWTGTPDNLVAEIKKLLE